MSLKTLTNRQKKFCELYVLNGGDRMKAYSDVYYKDKKKKDIKYEVLNSNSYNCLKHALVQERIKELQEIGKADFDNEFKQKQIKAIKSVLEIKQVAMNKTKRARVLIQKEKGTDLFGNVIYEETQDNKVVLESDPDLSIALKCDELIAKIEGTLKENITNNNININNEIFLTEKDEVR